MFRTTSWTAVVNAGHRDSPDAKEALTSLCQTYWQPLHAYLRRMGHNEDDAKDLTQQFFYLFLSKNYLQAADRTKGKFRSFLLTAVNHFLANEHDRMLAAKRGGGRAPLSLDAPADEDLPSFEPASDLSPVKIYERQWALTLFAQAQQKLRAEYAAAGKQRLYDAFKGFMESDTGRGDYKATAAELAMSVNAVTVAVFRMRQRLAELIREEVARTLVNPTPAEIEQERRHLYEIFSA